jgi:hypothetical protein
MLMPASINFVFKRYDPKTKDVIWKSVALTKFKAEGKSISSDQVVRPSPSESTPCARTRCQLLSFLLAPPSGLADDQAHGLDDD